MTETENGNLPDLSLFTLTDVPQNLRYMAADRDARIWNPENLTIRYRNVIMTLIIVNQKGGQL